MEFDRKTTISAHEFKQRVARIPDEQEIRFEEMEIVTITGERRVVGRYVLWLDEPA